MRKILLTATAAACLALAGCNDSSDGAGSGDKPSGNAPSGNGASATESPGGGTASALPGGAAPALGTPARTVGARTVGILEITPTTVVHTGKSGGTASKYGTFVVVTMREKSLSANPADEEKPAAGGWKWLAPDGLSTDAGNGNSAQVSLGKYGNHGAIQPDDTQLRAEVFDLTPAQARGGSAVYTDGTKAPYRWAIPAQDAGPDVADVRQQLNP
jgi:hypothetical protein